MGATSSPHLFFDLELGPVPGTGVRGPKTPLSTQPRVGTRPISRFLFGLQKWRELISPPSFFNPYPYFSYNLELRSLKVSLAFCMWYVGIVFGEITSQFHSPLPLHRRVLK